MADVVCLEGGFEYGFQCCVNLPRCTEDWANVVVNYDAGRDWANAFFGWNGQAMSTNEGTKRFLYQRPDLYNEVMNFVGPHSVQSLVDAARLKSCRTFEMAQYLPRPVLEYRPLDVFGPFVFEPATTMRCDPWLNFRVIGPGKRGQRRFYGSWNGQKITGRGWYELARMHPSGADHVRFIFQNTNPTELASFARYVDVIERIAA